MLTSWASLPDSMEEATEYIEGWVEHMRAGGFRCGRTIPDGLPASTRVGASQPGEGLMLVLSRGNRADDRGLRDPARVRAGGPTVGGGFPAGGRSTKASPPSWGRSCDPAIRVRVVISFAD
jgi:hypothetical protein